MSRLTFEPITSRMEYAVINMSSSDSVVILNIRPLTTTRTLVSSLDSSSHFLGFCSQLWRWNRWLWM